jgi:hypothetical protein
MQGLPHPSPQRLKKLLLNLHPHRCCYVLPSVADVLRSVAAVLPQLTAVLPSVAAVLPSVAAVLH